MSRIPLRSRCALIASALILIASTLHAQTDPMAKWKPNVGDVFVFQEAHQSTIYSHGIAHNGGTGGGEFQVIITQNDTIVNGHHDVVIGSGGQYWFHLSSDTSTSEHPLVIEENFNTTHDFTNSAVKQGTLGAKAISILSADNYSYSPDIRWFTGWSSSSDNTYTDGAGLEGSTYSVWVSLESANLASVNAVDRGFNYDVSVGNHGFVTVRYTNPSIKTIFLINPLGRPIRSWQLAASDGPREITLNVSDVPSGVYFLRLQGNGVDEVKRVAIIH